MPLHDFPFTTDHNGNFMYEVPCWVCHLDYIAPNNKTLVMLWSGFTYMNYVLDGPVDFAAGDTLTEEFLVAKDDEQAIIMKLTEQPAFSRSEWINNVERMKRDAPQLWQFSQSDEWRDKFTAF